MLISTHLRLPDPDTMRRCKCGAKLLPINEEYIVETIVVRYIVFIDSYLTLLKPDIPVRKRASKSSLSVANTI